MANDSPISLQQLFRYYRRELPHQTAAIGELEDDLRQNGYAVAMSRSRPWFQTWSQSGKVPELKTAIDLIKEFEGLSLAAYGDPLTGGAPWTIGWGATTYPDGKPVKQGDTVNRNQAEKMLQLSCEDISKHLAAVIPGWREMNDEMQSALVSFAFNLGMLFYNAVGFETISRTLRDRRWRDVPAALMLYRNPGTKVEEGLKRRRLAEGQLWLHGLSMLSAAKV